METIEEIHEIVMQDHREKMREITEAVRNSSELEHVILYGEILCEESAYEVGAAIAHSCPKAQQAQHLSTMSVDV